jgi:restriction system protein
MYRKPGSNSEPESADRLEEEEPAERWQDELLSTLQEMAPDAFERLAQRILRESGFVTVEVKGKSGDGGIDGIGVLRINLLSFRCFFSASATKVA